MLTDDQVQELRRWATAHAPVRAVAVHPSQRVGLVHISLRPPWVDRLGEADRHQALEVISRVLYDLER